MYPYLYVLSIVFYVSIDYNIDSSREQQHIENRTDQAKIEVSTIKGNRDQSQNSRIGRTENRK